MKFEDDLQNLWAFRPLIIKNPIRRLKKDYWKDFSNHIEKLPATFELQKEVSPRMGRNIIRVGVGAHGKSYKHVSRNTQSYKIISDQIGTRPRLL